MARVWNYHRTRFADILVCMLQGISRGTPNMFNCLLMKGFRLIICTGRHCNDVVLFSIQAKYTSFAGQNIAQAKTAKKYTVSDVNSNSVNVTYLCINVVRRWQSFCSKIQI